MVQKLLGAAAGLALAGMAITAQAAAVSVTDPDFFGPIISAADGPGVVGILNLETDTSLSFSRPSLGSGSGVLFDVVFTQKAPLTQDFAAY